MINYLCNKEGHTQGNCPYKDVFAQLLKPSERNNQNQMLAFEWSLSPRMSSPVLLLSTQPWLPLTANAKPYQTRQSFPNVSPTNSKQRRIGNGRKSYGTKCSLSYYASYKTRLNRVVHPCQTPLSRRHNCMRTGSSFHNFTNNRPPMAHPVATI